MRLATTWGSTPEERTRPFPCDGVLPEASDALYRAVDVAAPAAVTYRWLCQLRAAPYSYDWIDNSGRRSPRELTPGLEDLAPGQRVMRIFRLVAFERDRHITLVLDDPGGQRIFGDIAVTYAVVATGPDTSRIVVKMLIRRPRGLYRLVAGLLPAGDLVMMRKQLLTLKSLAERNAAAGRHIPS